MTATSGLSKIQSAYFSKCWLSRPSNTPSVCSAPTSLLLLRFCFHLCTTTLAHVGWPFREGIPQTRTALLLLSRSLGGRAETGGSRALRVEEKKVLKCSGSCHGLIEGPPPQSSLFAALSNNFGALRCTVVQRPIKQTRGLSFHKTILFPSETASQPAGTKVLCRAWQRVAVPCKLRLTTWRG